MAGREHRNDRFCWVLLMPGKGFYRTLRLIYSFWVDTGELAAGMHHTYDLDAGRRNVIEDDVVRMRDDFPQAWDTITDAVQVGMF